jgi:regulator of replication initiation timing
MKKEEFDEKIQEIGKLEDVADIRVKLAELSDDMTEAFSSLDSLKETSEKLTSENEKLRSANMELFLRVGANKSEEEIKEETIGKEEKEPEPRRFEDLFDGKGNLK